MKHVCVIVCVCVYEVVECDCEIDFCKYYLLPILVNTFTALILFFRYFDICTGNITM